MSTENVAMEVAEILKKPLAEAAGEAADLRMKELSGVVKKEMEDLPRIVDACLDGKCETIADKVLEKLPKAEPSTLAIEDVTKAVQAAMEEGKSHFTVDGHSAHDILDCPTCKPIVVKKLWENEEYRKTMAEKVCEDEECRDLFLKHYEKKEYGETENVGKDESWAERRIRERRA